MTHDLAVEPTAPTTIDAATLSGRLDDPELTIVDVRPITAYNGWRLGDEPRGGHIPGAVVVPGGLARRASTRPRSTRLLAGKGVRRAGGRRVRRRPPPTRGGRGRARGARASRRPRPSPAASRHGPADPTCPSTGSPQLRPARPHRVARPAPRRRPARGLADRPVPPLPRELRGPRGVRGGPPPGRPLSRHELARGPDRLEPAVAGRARRGACTPRHHATTRRSSSMAATRSATRTRSGPAGEPARSPRRAP